ncbi:bifunctional diaminohydroxyphosphoribosylaminopyrimidine deaminase/5-amino-6-(5-phosphoribosylamino)uracil reductase RibD [Legionella bononiensis]|uniref:Riboflavin biosynthesis protein RibD n=1 Tax=Legionella bononiensis TaxID=2793102 RepID=A0ABS1WBW9_9GAMM|nr:bifunctional diaminohydroxyphosphoribosylaminopyrimidine deaminase/5-amino-6-(5-phosphoribosylamino)uracil reductase RibD [Legionella bononiensis]MBL7481141.1 bifunctional diaminohydroxyphosphoribosylaminopyrimidine deaminase/5-amino-6-(5-phosphoribosylamino)uracil reductase RibD [Legionella bononiensis]MBL7526850.1 bifunctional diaminohydroxyphosphoribosylaminopyrimidine deaminase/5-amino-6-(5-phosphoribosylamino)uracil reductase RibD [Legionella bononiensis]MBL7564257.1 bifunctional diamino
MHEQFLLAALNQAKLGQGICAPNPSVGAVAVQNGNIIAQDWHRGAGSPHAEQLLLAQFTPKTPGVSLYITLEPCNHWGRTPPCVNAIINHGIEEVYFSYLDPNPLVAQNNSTALLQEHGIKVTHLPLPEIDEFYKSYTHWIVTHRPRVTVKMAQSLDGKIGRLSNERVILSNSLCAEFTHKMRAASDVILTSARTVERDNPRMNVRLNQQEQAKPVAIIDRDLSLSDESLVFSTASHCYIYHDEHRLLPDTERIKADPGQIRSNSSLSLYPNSTYHAMPLKSGRMDLNSIINHLGELGFHDVWVEAGGAIFSALHQEGLVHRTYLYIVPIFLGTEAVSAYQYRELFDREHKVSWHEMGDNMIACIDWQEV